MKSVVCNAVAMDKISANIETASVELSSVAAHVERKVTEKGFRASMEWSHSREAGRMGPDGNIARRKCSRPAVARRCAPHFSWAIS